MDKSTCNIIHVSHNDNDGVSCTLLTEFIVEAYPKGMFNLKTLNIVPSAIIGEVKKILNEIKNYDLVIITNLAISQEVVDLIENSGCSKKFKLFDHHQTEVDISKYENHEGFDFIILNIPDDSDQRKKPHRVCIYYTGKMLLFISNNYEVINDMATAIQNNKIKNKIY
jgi:hypothetical protein